MTTTGTELLFTLEGDEKVVIEIQQGYEKLIPIVNKIGESGNIWRIHRIAYTHGEAVIYLWDCGYFWELWVNTDPDSNLMYFDRTGIYLGHDFTMVDVEPSMIKDYSIGHYQNFRVLIADIVGTEEAGRMMQRVGQELLR